MSALSEYHLKLLINEALHYRKQVVGAFIAITALAVIVGLAWPKSYTVYTTIVVDERNIIQPLMEGAAVATEAADRSMNARDIIHGRRIMNQILVDAGWVKRTPQAVDQDQIIRQLISQTVVSNVGRNLIRIDYSDTDPQRAYRTTKRLAELYISESVAAKAAESRAAFEFIDKQAQEYHKKLIKAEEALKEFRSVNLDAQPDADSDVAARLGGFQSRIEDVARELSEAEIRKVSLEKQLYGEAETASLVSRENQYRLNIADLQTELETLRLTYHDTYPDIVHLRHQINDLNQAIAAERKRRKATRAEGRTLIDETAINNPMYQQLRRDLSQAQVQIDMLKARMQQARVQLQAELDRSKRVHGGTVRLAELTRDYQVNREIYQDLLRRRENARVSMNLDRENHGLTFRILEPARPPHRPNGPRYWHFMLAGLVLGLVVPLVLIYTKLQIDPRLRIAPQVADRIGLPLLTTVPHLWSAGETLEVRRDVLRLAWMVGGTVLAVMAVGLLKLTRVF